MIGRVYSTTMEDTLSGRRRNNRGERTREALVQAAVGQLAEEGMRGLTHRLVEQRAGQAQGSVKHHFGSLDGLVTAVVEYMVAMDLPLVLAPEVAAGDDVPALIAQAQAAMEAVWSRPDLLRARMELYLHAARYPQLQQIVAAGRDRFVERIAQSLPGPDSELAARFVAAAMDGLIFDQLSGPDPAIAQQAGLLVVHAGFAGRAISTRALVNPSAEEDRPHRDRTALSPEDVD